MKTFEVTLTIEASDCTTEEDIRKILEENSTLIEFDLSEGDITDITVSIKKGTLWMINYSRSVN